jgi:hypothetical protein
VLIIAIFIICAIFFGGCSTTTRHYDANGNLIGTTTRESDSDSGWWAKWVLVAWVVILALIILFYPR